MGGGLQLGHASRQHGRGLPLTLPSDWSLSALALQLVLKEGQEGPDPPSSIPSCPCSPTPFHSLVSAVQKSSP